MPPGRPAAPLPRRRPGPRVSGPKYFEPFNCPFAESESETRENERAEPICF